MRILFCFFWILGPLFANAAKGNIPDTEVNTTVSGQTNLNNQYAIYFIKKNEGNKSDELSLSKDGSFQWQTKIKTSQFILVSIQLKARTQQLATNFTLYINPGDHIRLNLHYSDSTFLSYKSGNLNSENKALFSYFRFATLEDIRLFRNPPAPGSLRAEVGSYIQTANRLLDQLSPKDTAVKQYLRAWSFNDYLEAMDRYGNERTNEIRSMNNDSLYSFKEIYDHKTTTLLPASARFINKFLNGLTGPTDEHGLALLRKKIGLLNDSFSNPDLKEWLTVRYLQEAITKFSVRDFPDFDAQVSIFTAIAGNVRDQEVRDRLIDEFSNLRYTRIGSPMPDVVFKDANGRDVALRSFKGKSVYIDLWASWCIPCIAEVPHLKELEKDYEGKNIVFVSLSLDADKDAWKHKMKSLQLDGIQLELGDSGFDKMMNIQGIPHFLLYDSSGKLVKYQAPRPGTKEIRSLLDSL